MQAMVRLVGSLREDQFGMTHRNIIDLGIQNLSKVARRGIPPLHLCTALRPLCSVSADDDKDVLKKQLSSNMHILRTSTIIAAQQGNRLRVGLSKKI